MPTVSQDINQRVTFSTTRKLESLGDAQQKLTIAEADIIFYGEDALAGAKEFARLEVGQGFSWMTGGMSKASVVFVRRGVWALYDAEEFRGQMVVVSAGEAEGQLSTHNGIHVLAAPVRSYKRLR
jgi:Beta/Gamma crystallin